MTIFRERLSFFHNPVYYLTLPLQRDFSKEKDPQSSLLPRDVCAERKRALCEQEGDGGDARESWGTIGVRTRS
jgi:hypothetical protein